MTRFHTLTDHDRLVFTRLEAIKPKAGQPGFYPGVLIIQKGAAKGHYAVKDGDRVVNFDRDNAAHADLQKYPIVIGDVSLDDVTRCGVDDEFTKCKLDHGQTVRDVVGDYSNFRRDGDQVRADLTLMVSTEYREFVEELFSKFAKKVGNSIDFDYSYEIQGNVAVARCVKLNSVDIVDAPAATNSLFNEETNPTNTPHMPLSKEDLDAIGGVIDTKLNALETGINTRLGKIETTVTKLEEVDDEDEEEKKKKKAKEYADGKDAMSEEKMGKLFLSQLQKVFPKAAVENLTALSAITPAGKDEYAEKHAAAMAIGMTSGQATNFMANKHKALYNAKFGAPVVDSTKL